MTIQESGSPPESPRRPLSSPSLSSHEKSTKMIESLVSKLFRQMDAGPNPNIRNLTAAQREKLFSLTEGCNTFDDRIANKVLYARQLQDLDLLYKSPLWRDLGLPPQQEADTLSQDEIAHLLKSAKDKIDEMMKSAAVFGFPPVSQKDLLRDSEQLLLLISLYDLARDISKPQFLFSHKEEIIERLRTLFQYLQEDLKEAKKASEAVLGHPIADSTALLQANEAIFKNILEASSPEEFRRACTEAAQNASSLETARLAEFRAVCQNVKTVFHQLSPYFPQEGLFSNFQTLLNPPKTEVAQIWAQEVCQTLAEFRPLTYLIEAVQDHLKPYQTGAIRPRDEDQSRSELRSTLIPKFRAAFPSYPLSDEDVERFILSVYVEEGLRGVSFHALNATSFQFAEAEAGELANAALATMDEHFSAYVKALRHSLRIDFRSMNLTDDEVETLARKAAFSTSPILTRNWRNPKARP